MKISHKSSKQYQSITNQPTVLLIDRPLPLTIDKTSRTSRQSEGLLLLFFNSRINRSFNLVSPSHPSPYFCQFIRAEISQFTSNCPPTTRIIISHEFDQRHSVKVFNSIPRRTLASPLLLFQNFPRFSKRRSAIIISL